MMLLLCTGSAICFAFGVGYTLGWRECLKRGWTVPKDEILRDLERRGDMARDVTPPKPQGKK